MTPRSIPAAIETGGGVANTHNVLSAIATARVRDADSVAVRFGRSGSALETITPAFVAQSETVVVPVLGLLPETPYTLQVVAYGAGHVVAGDALAFTTGSLPADLPTYVTTGSNPSPGYVVLAAGPYGLVIDNQGRVVWYHRFPQGPGLNFQAQPNGRYVARPPAPGGADGTDLIARRGAWARGVRDATTSNFGAEPPTRPGSARQSQT